MPDLLHLLLRQVSHLYYHTAQKHCGSVDAIKALHEWMKTELHVRCNSSKRASKNQDAVVIMRRKESFIGRECTRLLGKYQQLVDYVYDVMLKGKFPQRKANAKAAWAAFDSLWQHLTTRIGPEGAKQLPSQDLRDAAAAECQRLADLFIRSFALAAGSDQAASSIYLHIIKFHLADSVREYGNLMDFSCQGSEHVHKLVKTAFKLSNGHEDIRLLSAAVRAGMKRKWGYEEPNKEGTYKKRGKANKTPAPANTLCHKFKSQP